MRRVHITKIPVAHARMLRDAILRPNFPPGGSVYPGDDAPDTLHLGALVDGDLAAIATVCREAPPGEEAPYSWRLRGMATVESHRGRGLGQALAEACMEHARDREGRLIWCSARETVASFYERLGFVRLGEPFALPNFSAHTYVRMQRDL